MLLAAYLSTCFVVAGIAASYLLEGRFPRRAKLMLKLAVVFASIVVPLQIVVGDLHGLNTERYQPAKVAALEAHWESEAYAPLLILAWPDKEGERNRFELGIPGLGSLILKHSFSEPVTGLKEFPPEERPPVAPIFYSFRVMVGIGLLMLFAGWAGLVQLLRGKLEQTRWLLRLYRYIAPVGFVALLAGWVTTEVGRQPFLVHGAMRTADGLSPVPGSSILTAIVLFVLVYAVVFGAGTYYVLRLIRQGPLDVEPSPRTAPTPARPLSVPPESIEEGAP
jgi:cytochrome d ubiquinol oxidase subunit I